MRMVLQVRLRYECMESWRNDRYDLGLLFEMII